MSLRARVVSRWRVMLAEAWGLGTFMVSACAFTILLEHPASIVHGLLPDAGIRRVLVGIAMGVTAFAIMTSPWGRRSGAHINPAVTLAQLRLGRISATDAALYVVSQCAGGLLGVLVVEVLAPTALSHPSVAFVVTVPQAGRVGAAFVAEACISFFMMVTVLAVSGDPRAAPHTPKVAAALVALYISFEAPLSGMSMNPARSLASAIPSGVWTGFWIYLVAPTAAMLLAAEMHRRLNLPRALRALSLVARRNERRPPPY